MVLVLAGCLAAMMRFRETPDLASDPRLQQKVDVHLKRVLLPDLLHYLKLHSNQRYIMEEGLKPLMVCVFANKQPLWLIMKDVAEVVAGQWKDLGSEWRLVELPEAKVRLVSYESAEKATLHNDVSDRAQALCDAASKYRWRDLASSSDSVLANASDDIAPKRWAEAKVHDPAYYVAGLMFARTGILNGRSKKFDCPGGFGAGLQPTAYRLVVPPNDAVAATLQCSAAGEEGAGLEGIHICVRPAQWCGTLQSVVVGNGSRDDNRPKHLIRYPRPVGDLAATKAGRWLLDWDTPLDDSDQEILDKKVPNLSLPVSPFFGGQQGIEEYLEALADTLQIPVVSDAFRIPVVGKEPAKGDKVRQWLTSLRQRQNCFIRVQNGSICVRHGGFWTLRELEIPEEALRRFESIPSPDLNDYADFAFEQGMWGRHDGTYMMPFFETQDVPLTLFDSKPFRTSPVVLAAFGQLTGQQRTHILSGGFVNWYRDIADDQELIHHITYQKTAKTSQRIVRDDPTVEGGAEGADYFINFSASWGAFYGGIPIGLEQRLLESCIQPAAYRSYWGDDPDNVRSFVESFDPVTLFHAHFLSLREVHRSDTAPSGDLPARLYGTFSFFSAVSNVDGVVNSVVIPDKSAVTLPLEPSPGTRSGGGGTIFH